FLAVFVIAISFILLSMRRSVMGLSALGVAFTMGIFLTPQNFKSTLGFTFFLVFVGFIIIFNTSFLDLFAVRYVLRDLDDRELGEEKRFLEYVLIFIDMLVYKNYSL